MNKSLAVLPVCEIEWHKILKMWADLVAFFIPTVSMMHVAVDFCVFSQAFYIPKTEKKKISEQRFTSF